MKSLIFIFGAQTLGIVSFLIWKDMPMELILYGLINSLLTLIFYCESKDAK